MKKKFRLPWKVAAMCVLFSIVGLVFVQRVEARNFRVAMLPQPDGDRFSCLTCHVSAGGGGPRNAFGRDVEKFVSPGGNQPFWNQVFALDSDGDGATNGRELGDADGNGSQDDGVTFNDIFQPGNASSTPPPPPPPVPEPAAPEPDEIEEPLTPVQISMARRPAEFGGNVDLEWSGGQGPFLIERKNALDDDMWFPAASAVDSQGAAILSGDSGFFRVRAMDELSPTLMTAEISGAMERPNPITTDGRGSGNFRIDRDIIVFEIHYNGLSGPATRAHIHGPANTTQTGGVMIDLAPYHVGEFGTSGVFKGAARMTEAQKGAILMGLSYVNIHTEANGPGEIRGQIAPVNMGALVNGQNERPNPVHTQGRGRALVSLVGSDLTLRIDYWDLSGAPTAAHIHGPAGVDQSTGVLVALEPLHIGPLDSPTGAFYGTLRLTSEQLGPVIDGMSYINIHTATNRPGEIRGQILPILTGMPMTAVLSGSNERPNPVTSDGTGFAQARLVKDGIFVLVTYQGLTGPATRAHIHGPATTSESAGVMVDLAPIHVGPFGSSGMFKGFVPLTPEQQSVVLNGMSYINIHTVANGPGEIRGQLVQTGHWVTMNGESERPNPVLTMASASGVGSLVGDTLSLNLLYSGLSGPATASHIHGTAHPEQNAGVLIDLAPFNGGGFGSVGRIFGSGPLGIASIGPIADGLTYVNIHTAAHGPGEIRGQLLTGDRHASVMTTSLNGAASRPNPVTTTATGKGTLTLIANQLYFTIDYSGLSGTATAAHIHGPSTSEGTGGVLIDLEPFNGGSFGQSGTFTGMVELTPPQLAAIRKGATYINIHTPTNPAGEIRGQIGGVNHTIALSAARSRPNPNTSTATGSGRFKLVYDQLLMDVEYADLSAIATAAHIHGPAGPESTAGVMVDLAPFNGGAFGVSGNFNGLADISADIRGSIIDGRTYLNIHTSNNPSGEIRGQITRHLIPPTPIIANLTGDTQVPAPVNTSATGTGHFTLAGSVLYINVEYSGLSGAATAAHIHGPAEVGSNAGVLIDLAPFNGGAFGSEGSFQGAVALKPSQQKAILKGLTYINIHTPTNPAGEIRGQLIPR